MPKVSGAMNPSPEIRRLGGKQEKNPNSEQKQENEYQGIYPTASYGFVESQEQKKAFLEYQRASQEQRESSGYGNQSSMGLGQQQGNKGFGQQQGNIGYGQQQGFNKPPPQSYQQNPNLKQQSSPPPPPQTNNNQEDDFQ